MKLDREEKRAVLRFCRLNGIEADHELIFMALCHSSFTNELAQNGGRELESNERMEFLGDAVLEFCIANILYTDFDLSEGEMSKLRAMLGSERVLSQIARELRIGEFLFLGKGERLTGGAERDSLLADSFEAILAAIYLSRGVESAMEFVRSSLQIRLAEAAEGSLILDYKTSLQELTQAHFGSRPLYSPVQEEGPPQEKWFEVEVSVDGRVLGAGAGRTKKAAEQAAAKVALQALTEELGE